MYTVAISPPGVLLPDAAEQPLTIIFRTRWRGIALFVYFLHTWYGPSRVIRMEWTDA